MRRHLFALAWADARVTGDAEEKAVTFRLRAKAFGCIHPHSPPQGGREKEGFPQGFVEWRSIFLLVCLVMLRGKPLIICLIGRLRQAEPLILYKR